MRAGRFDAVEQTRSASEFHSQDYVSGGITLADNQHSRHRVQSSAMEGYSFVGLDWLSLIGVSVAIYLVVELFSRVQAREKAREERSTP